MLVLSVSSSAIGSPARTASPSRLSHETSLADLMPSPRSGNRTSVAMHAEPCRRVENGRCVQTVLAIEIDQVARLPEVIDAEHHHALTLHGSEPRQGRSEEHTSELV